MRVYYLLTLLILSICFGAFVKNDKYQMNVDVSFKQKNATPNAKVILQKSIFLKNRKQIKNRLDIFYLNGSVLNISENNYFNHKNIDLHLHGLTSTDKKLFLPDQAVADFNDLEGYLSQSSGPVFLWQNNYLVFDLTELAGIAGFKQVKN